jgi:hypothetical protein
MSKRAREREQKRMGTGDANLLQDRTHRKNLSFREIKS